MNEFRIPNEDRVCLQSLLSEAFPGYLDNRIYFKQLPTFRIVSRESNSINAQVGIEHRAVRLGANPARIFGVIDLAVRKEARRQGLGKALLEEVERIALTSKIDFIVLFADDHRLYEKCGFSLKSNKCTWLKIDNHQTLGIGKDRMGDCLMIKKISGMDWDETADFDLLGYMF